MTDDPSHSSPCTRARLRLLQSSGRSQSTCSGATSLWSFPSFVLSTICSRTLVLTQTVPLQIAGFHPFCAFLGLATYQVPFPSLSTILTQLAVFFVVEDTVHYWSHRWLHTPKLYKFVPRPTSSRLSCAKSLISLVTPVRDRWIHKVHHEYPAPFGLTAEYAHPLEVMILGSGTIGGPIIYCALTRNLHLLTMLIWITLRVASLPFFFVARHSFNELERLTPFFDPSVQLCQAVSAHSGYDFPWSLRHILPFWAGAEHHDWHHMSFINVHFPPTATLSNRSSKADPAILSIRAKQNFSSSFRHWDYLLGTDTKYRAYRARIDAEKTKEARERLRQIEDEKMEAEGVVLAQETIARA